MWPGIPDTYQKLPESDSGSFRYTRSHDYQTPTRHALLGHGKRTSTSFAMAIQRLTLISYFTDWLSLHSNKPMLQNTSHMSWPHILLHCLRMDLCASQSSPTCPLWPNGWTDHLVWRYASANRHCVKWEPSSSPLTAAPTFRLMSIVAKWSPISATSQLLSTFWKSKMAAAAIWDFSKLCLLWNIFFGLAYENPLL